jgi:ABC-type sugar transport system ATPase subunit
MSLTDQTHSPDQTAVNGDRVVLVAEKITKRYPGTVALDQVDFTVYAG